MSAKDSRQLIKWAKKKGWTATFLKGSGHYRLEKPGHDWVMVGSSISDHMAVTRVKSLVAKAEREALERSEEVSRQPGDTEDEDPCPRSNGRRQHALSPG